MMFNLSAQLSNTISDSLLTSRLIHEFYSMEYNAEELNHLIKKRRSVFPKQFDAGRHIPDHIVLQILENATWAPTHGVTEPWHFVVFTRDGLKKLAAFQSELYKKETGEKFKADKYRNLQNYPLQSSHVIAIGLKRDPSKKIPEIEEIEAVAASVQNMYLSATAYGLGCYWSSGGITYMEKAKSFFGLGEADKLLGFFYLAYVAVPSPAGKRKPLQEKMVWVERDNDEGIADR